ncbi:PROTEIN-S ISOPRENYLCYSTEINE O-METHYLTRANSFERASE [Salix koriyanagi]|uniref:Protein-S-isoprenylcysteine O-methyltransferase n=1 Tax=Salix koriyanagi TaxID=2511006 RepID=A0A9Q0ZGC3_9ROSI|nr:PROTEIN-S ISOPRENYLCYSTEINE O-METHYLTRANSFERASE [Salix koriyanagi]
MTEIFGYTACRQLSQMFLAVLFFHSSEYVLVAAIHGRSSVNLSSLLISKAYVFAMMFALLEYVVEIALVSWVEGILVDKQFRSCDGYNWGDYSEASDFGTQIMLCNPISTIGFAIVVWRFFAQRIPYEEFFLEAVFWVGVRGICFENSFWNSICEVKFLWSLHTELNSFATLILFHGERFRKVPVILCGRDLELVRS